MVEKRKNVSFEKKRIYDYLIDFFKAFNILTLCKCEKYKLYDVQYFNNSFKRTILTLNSALCNLYCMQYCIKILRQL